MPDQKSAQSWDAHYVCLYCTPQLMFEVRSESASIIWSGTLLLTGCWTGNNSMLVEVALLSLPPMNLAEEMGNSSLAVNNHAALSLSLSVAWESTKAVSIHKTHPGMRVAAFSR